MYQSASRVPEAADLSRRRSVLVDSPPRPLAAKRREERVSIAHSIVGGSAREQTPWRAAAEVVSGSEIAATTGWAVTAGQEYRWPRVVRELTTLIDQA
jgi:hypothetical protein